MRLKLNLNKENYISNFERNFEYNSYLEGVIHGSL